VLGSAAIVGLAIYLPGADAALGTVALGVPELAVAVGFATIPAVLTEVAKLIRASGVLKRRPRHPGSPRENP
jgi:hypothetical protein